MAASISDDSNKAPENFRISSSSSSDEDEDCCDSQINTNYCRRRCPLCTSLRKLFFCQNCIQIGDIVHTSNHHVSERLSEKQEKYQRLQITLNNCNFRYETLISKLKKTENVRFEIKRKQEKIALLNHLINGKREELTERVQYRVTLKKENQRERNLLPTYEVNVKKLEDYVSDRLDKISKLREQNEELLDKVKKKARIDIEKLVNYIFPISEIVLKDDNSRDRNGPFVGKTGEELSETIAALAEAKNTSYIGGKWVFHGSGISEMQYRIIAPSLPANGDYTAYLDWLAENNDDVPKSTANEIIPSRVAAFRIVGALTYSTQLTNILSFYLNIRLPYKLAYGDFCKKLNKQQFMRKVSRLNTNIMYLAYTQRVKLSILNENHTLENMLAILNLEDLGLHGPHEVTFAPLMKSIDSLLIGVETGTESESEDENSHWEAVPNLPTTNESNQLVTSPLNQQTASIAGGLMTSAAHSIASIFRWGK